MKITRSRLKEIIKEELRLLKESNIISEDGHTDVPSARRKMKTSVEDAMQILQGLEAMPDEGELPSWWMGKVTLAADYLNKARDYFLVSEAKEAGVPEDRRKNLLFRLTKFTRDNDLRKRVAEVIMLALSDAKELGIEEVEQVFRNKFKDPSFLTKVKGEKPIPLEESLEDRINPDDDDLEQAGFRPDPEEVTRLLAKKFPDLADGRVTKKIGKNDLMVFIAEEYDISEQTAMQVVEELIQEGFIGMFTDFVNIINADFDEDYDDYEDDAYAMASAGFGTDEDYGFYGESIEKMVREELSRLSMSEGLETLMSHMNPEDLGLIIKVLGKVAYNFSPAVFGTIAYSAARRIAGLDSEFEKRQEIERLAAEYKGKQS